MALRLTLVVAPGPGQALSLRHTSTVQAPERSGPSLIQLCWAWGLGDVGVGGSGCGGCSRSPPGCAPGGDTQGTLSLGSREQADLGRPQPPPPGASGPLLAQPAR